MTEGNETRNEIERNDANRKITGIKDYPTFLNLNNSGPFHAQNLLN